MIASPKCTCDPENEACTSVPRHHPTVHRPPASPHSWTRRTSTTRSGSAAALGLASRSSSAPTRAQKARRCRPPPTSGARASTGRRCASCPSPRRSSPPPLGVAWGCCGRSCLAGAGCSWRRPPLRCCVRREASLWRRARARRARRRSPQPALDSRRVHYPGIQVANASR